MKKLILLLICMSSLGISTLISAEVNNSQSNTAEHYTPSRAETAGKIRALYMELPKLINMVNKSDKLTYQIQGWLGELTTTAQIYLPHADKTGEAQVVLKQTKQLIDAISRKTDQWSTNGASKTQLKSLTGKLTMVYVSNKQKIDNAMPLEDDLTVANTLNKSTPRAGKTINVKSVKEQNTSEKFYTSGRDKQANNTSQAVVSQQR